MKQLERDEQRKLITWARQHDNLGVRMMFAIPNGGGRKIVEAYQMKLAGTLAGIPDLFLPVPNSKCGGMFIEMKHGKGKPSAEQKVVLTDLATLGYHVVVCYSAEQAMCCIKEYLSE